MDKSLENHLKERNHAVTICSGYFENKEMTLDDAMVKCYEAGYLAALDELAEIIQKQLISSAKKGEQYGRPRRELSK